MGTSRHVHLGGRGEVRNALGTAGEKSIVETLFSFLMSLLLPSLSQKKEKKRFKKMKLLTGT